MKIEEKAKVVHTHLAEIYGSKSGAKVDRFGNIVWCKNDNEYRLKFKSNVIRKEVKIKYTCGGVGWIRTRSFNINEVYTRLAG